jgi:hypothetical protein
MVILVNMVLKACQEIERTKARLLAYATLLTFTPGAL